MKKQDAGIEERIRKALVKRLSPEKLHATSLEELVEEISIQCRQLNAKHASVCRKISSFLEVFDRKNDSV